ncbi:beta-N-acetylhexosaminidase [Sphingomonas morindae]|uniref:beta-N-acetylhexosaminidase n=1 Tax=Sphingomonas morindae TaxID=1541170 RepID=A0ABY4X8M2_9SPHN|nr:beta-N-acetylhexosaminidase [Sphingomonas morindae]USI73304.1 beta-N-acetylhexosaminidase [Sphingomonas morindae]
MIPAMFGLAGPDLSAEERAFFRDAEPAGYVLFRRNCVSRDQLARLTAELRALAGRDDLAILIDQEGGRVQRMAPPEWPALPPAERFAQLWAVAPVSAMEAARLNALSIAAMLREVGITVDLLPLLDVRRPDADAIIGDRALGTDPAQVAALGRLVLDGLREGGVVGVIKHMPGHGRALVDSHKSLPVVTADAAALEEDLRPFAALADAPMGMTAHIIFTAWDAERCASLSPVVIGEVIRGRIGFDGLLMSDDLGMEALDGGYGARAAGVVAAGCDVALHCSGVRAEMEAVAGALGSIAPVSRARLDRAMASVAGLAPAETAAAYAAQRDALLALA